ncbi:ABC transporter related protein [Magnetococcus marinus MC-1]|uniref:ABC transporter related protein n=1 Tax=Magnetococcus marinus (strain ATCC BAA-1437 / JCM 17883 / MC-1) TaxID=156889 RepID=A0LAD3_MAGMM|nr:ABC transporter ATP-binding protein [Magnetococcus marinus]ABK44926.1 ABC transporter related protein [Magnetococcus marinus MC-1]
MSQYSLVMEEVSKLYRLGEVGSGTLSHDLNRWLARWLGRQDPYEKLGQTNDRTQVGGDFVWALKDIDLKVPQGEILGIIGKNGAGKSTLLKLLSRVTAPTRGAIYVQGRIASLLEVGTGFHPELTGRENIFLNGAILGMKRAEIRKKLDEIVEFSGVAKYLDTPVKRYSSGMHVRLAFAVAAHLEPDILIVDEVLAVGDAEFQAKCLGKMQAASQGEGRTVLFVSHNLGAVKQLCPRAILMEQGQIKMQDETGAVISRYMQQGGREERQVCWPVDQAPQQQEIILHSIRIVDHLGQTDSLLATGNPITAEIEYTLKEDLHNLRITFTVLSHDGVEIFSSSDYLFQKADRLRPKGRYKSVCHIPGGLMSFAQYIGSVDFEIPGERGILMDQKISFAYSEISVNQYGQTRSPAPPGLIHPLLTWDIVSI